MNYRAILLVTGGVMLGALTFSAIGVSAHSTGERDPSGERRGKHGFEQGRQKHEEGKKYAAEVLGLTTEEIRVELDSGKTMEEVILAQGYESIESFREEVEALVREKLAQEGLSEEEINERIERHNERREHRLEHRLKNFDETRFRERMEQKGLSEDEITSRLERTQERIDSLSN